MNNIRITLAYDGTSYFGFQKTNKGPSIEGSLIEVLEKILGHKISLQAASRTDRGVHARCQVVNFFTEKKIDDLDRFKISVNSLLAPDITVLECEKANDTFHPTLDCTSKEYRYYLSTCNLYPEHQRFCWQTYKKLDFDKMSKASKILTGTHDFASFTNVKKNEPYKTTVRCVESFWFQNIDGPRIEFIIKGKEFLYKMVRNLVGTVYYVGLGKIPLDDVKIILKEKKRPLAGVTAPAKGLFLHRIIY